MKIDEECKFILLGKIQKGFEYFDVIFSYS